jgi:hypothetical protein
MPSTFEDSHSSSADEKCLLGKRRRESENNLAKIEIGSINKRSKISDKNEEIKLVNTEDKSDESHN